MLEESEDNMQEKIVSVNDQNIAIKEYKGRRVVTFKDIDAVHERAEGTARKRFNDNRKHFIEGEDFFKVPFNESPENGQSIFDVVTTMEHNAGIDYSGFIYIAIDPNNGLIKIGRTRNKAKRRISSLNVGRTEKILEYEYFNCKDTLKAEKNIHKIFSDVRKNGEWFDVKINEARRVIKEETEKVDRNYDPSKRHRGGNRSDITLVTESGYLMLVKSFTDDLAWDVQRQLVKRYFAPEPIQSTITYQYPLPAATFEGVANLGRLIERIMRTEGACPHEIAIVLKPIFEQAGLEVNERFIKIPAYEQYSLDVVMR